MVGQWCVNWPHVEVVARNLLPLGLLATAIWFALSLVEIVGLVQRPLPRWAMVGFWFNSGLLVAGAGLGLWTLVLYLFTCR